MQLATFGVNMEYEVKNKYLEAIVTSVTKFTNIVRIQNVLNVTFPYAMYNVNGRARVVFKNTSNLTLSADVRVVDDSIYLDKIAIRKVKYLNNKPVITDLYFGQTRPTRYIYLNGKGKISIYKEEMTPDRVQELIEKLALHEENGYWHQKR